MLREALQAVREKHPLVHNITNYVTVNDVANVLLAAGASPIMSDDEEEVEDITSLCGGLVLNIGTLNHRTIPSMLKAGKKAKKLGHPVVLDPVGAGASPLRTETALQIIEEVQPTVIRGNISEIKALALGGNSTQGVDADLADAVTEENIGNVVKFAKDYARKTEAILAITGAIDLITDGKTAYSCRNGNPMMSTITGTGCQLTALVAAYLVANPDHALEAVITAVCSMGVCGELAKERLGEVGGNASYRTGIIDAIFHLTGEALEKRAKIQEEEAE